MLDIKKEVDNKILHRIEMLYDKCVWLGKDKEYSVLEMNDLDFNTILKYMRTNYGQRFNLWQKEQRLRKIRQEYLVSKSNQLDEKTKLYLQRLDEGYISGHIDDGCPF